ncbi:MAG: glycoside hydrolase family 15 protein, partial [Nitriliruptorales bacterium]|nr:glycoside hydrolase family 15 protein [Nitriliruptorales bacterium]
MVSDGEPGNVEGRSAGGPYPPIGDYALLGDCHSTALVSRSGSIDWACLRRFDSPSVFGRLLDWERGGFFALSPVGLRHSSRRYLEGTLVLETIADTATGTARILDAFAMRHGGRTEPHHQLLRVVEGLTGRVEIDVVMEPRFDYGDLRPWLRTPGPGTFTAVGGEDALVLHTDAELALDDDRTGIRGRFAVTSEQRVRLSLVSQWAHELDRNVGPIDQVDRRLDQTVAWWRGWSADTVADGPYEAHIRQSAAVLKALTCAPSGAVVAAPTTSLPERIGGERNWDYRYSWVRDSTLTVDALSLAGHREVARGFRDFLMRSAAGQAEDLQILYGPYGARRLDEFEVGLSGYRGSRPVRVGNAAANQRQLDVHGHILDLAHQWGRLDVPPEPDEWRFLRQVVDAAADNADKPDQGIWEMRGASQHFVHSKVMVWVALDRGVRICEALGRDLRDAERWSAVRDRLRKEIEGRGLDAAGEHFVQAYGSEEVDASLLRLSVLGFVDAHDARMIRTVEVIRERLAVPPHGFLRRYSTATVR